MAAWLSQRSTILSTFSAQTINYSTLTGSAITLNSTMISLGTSTNSVYTRMSQGNFNSSVSTSSWVSSLTGRVSTTTVAMSANAQYQLALSQSSISTSVMFTSTLGSSWSTLSGVTGLPNYSTISYTAGAISGTGQYGVLGTNNNNLYTTTNYGQSWSNTNLSTIAVYLPFDTVPASAGTYADTTGRSAVTYTGPPTQAPSYVTGTGAVRLANATPGGVSSQYIQGTWGNVGLTSFTISFWFNIQSYGANASYIFSAYNGALAVVTAQTSNNLGVNIPITASPYYATFTTPSPIAPVVNTWYNITIIYQSSGTCYLYLNNALYGTIAGAGLFGGTQTNKFGISGFDSTPGTSASFNGYIDDLKIYNSAIFTLPTPLSLTYNNVAVSNTGQYMLATVTNGGLYMSSNFGSTWSQVTGAMLSALWSNAQVSATGQYMLVNAAPQIVQPQLTGLASSGTALTTSPWQANSITWIASTSSVLNSSYPVSSLFDTIYNSTYYANGSQTYKNTGNTNINTTTIIGVGSINGDWVQIQSSVPMVMYSYQLGTSGLPQQAPKAYYIVGSNDNINWYPIQYALIAANAAYASGSILIPNVILVNSSSTQTIGTSTLAGTTYSTTTTAYTYFRMVITLGLQSAYDYIGFSEWFINFQAGGQTYSTNYGTTWNNGYAVQTPTALSLSGSGQYAIGANAPQILAELNFENNYVDSIGGLATGVLSGTTANVTFTSTSKVGSSSLAISNTAGATSGLGYVNYTIPSGHPLRSPTLLTIAFWMYPTSISQTLQMSPLGFNNGTNGAGPYFYFISKMAFAYYTSTSTSGAITGTTTIAQSTWVHVAITFLNGNLILYVNGVVEASAVITGSLSLDLYGSYGPITNMFIGCEHTGFGGYNGYIDNVRIYNTALSQSQINTLYTTPATAALTVPPVYITSLQGFSTGTSTTPTFQTPLNAATNNPVASAVSNTGQYMVVITNNISGNNVYYSTNYGSTFTGLQLGTQVLTSCAMSYDGSYITIASGATVYTLNNNSTGFSVALGNQAGAQNQAVNSIAIGNYAGYQNQTANSIILNASGSVGLNSYTNGFYVSPIASYAASVSPTMNLLGYGTDNQVVQTGITVLSGSAGQTIYGEWIQYQLATPTSINAYVLQARPELTNRYPVAWNLVGSVDGINWIILDYQNSQSSTLWGTSYVLKSASAVYSYFRIIITNITSALYTDIGAFILYNSNGSLFGTYTNYTSVLSGNYALLQQSGVTVCTVSVSYYPTVSPTILIGGFTSQSAYIATTNAYLQGSGYWTSFYVSSTGPSSEYNVNYIAQMGTSTLANIIGAGNVGIGTSSPGYPLSIYSNNIGGNVNNPLILLSLNSYTPPTNVLGQSVSNSMILGVSYPAGNSIYGFAGGMISGGTIWGVNAYLSFTVTNPNNLTNPNILNNGYNTECMRMLGNGNVGIGTTNPAHTLDVNGSIRTLGGLVTCTYSTANPLGASSFNIYPNSFTPNAPTGWYLLTLYCSSVTQNPAVAYIFCTDTGFYTVLVLGVGGAVTFTLAALNSYITISGLNSILQYGITLTKIHNVV